MIEQEIAVEARTREIYGKINRIVDPEHPTELEKTHVPVVQLTSTPVAGEPVEVLVRVGQENHPMDPEHHIEWIDLYENEVFLSRLTFVPVATRPVAVLQIALEEPTKLRAVAFCSKYGLWEGSTEVKVSRPS
ncbi:MAG: class II SORL domain-containing protein [Chloroflexi bacterium]|nr:class II SORL domain-containing protein [Chloroflexota bacterium]